MSSSDRKPKSVACTFCFLDIAGFSISSTKLHPAVVFRILDSFFGMIENIVCSKGGIVDKIMGDGMLFYFEAKAGEPHGQHATNAVRSAIEIQTATLNFNLPIFEKHQIIFPLRIGINSAFVYSGEVVIGNIPTRVVLGEGLNFAKRLEESCLENHITVSPVTLDLIEKSELGVEIFPISIKIKHAKALTRVFCINPFNTSQKNELINLEMSLRKKNAIYRKETRTMLLTKPVSIYGNGSSGIIKDFSRNGLRVELSSCYGVGVDIEIYFGQLDSDLSKLMFDLNLQPLIYQVRWTVPIGEKVFSHGLKLSLSSTIQKNFLFSIFEEYEKGSLTYKKMTRLIG